MRPRALLLAILTLVALAAAWGGWRLILQDKCLDAGGTWRDGACDRG